MTGFGYFDATEYEPKPDLTSWIVENLIPKNSFGFVAGPPKGNASPYGGKSVFERKLALCVITGVSFMDYRTLEKGKIMFVNLDEDQDKQVRLYYRMTQGVKIPGYLISRATSLRLPDQVRMLEEDVKQARPAIIFIDPLQRVMGGKKVKEQADVGPIIDVLKNMAKEYETTVILNHHSNKDSERDKENTASWLSGSNDLDAAWDFCLCLEYEKKFGAMHVRNFQKEKARSDFYYEAIIRNDDEIIDLYRIPEELAEHKKARDFLKAIKSSTAKDCKTLSEKAGISERSAYYYLQSLQSIKTAIAKTVTCIEEKPLQSKI